MLKLGKISKFYKNPYNQVDVLVNLDLEIQENEIIALRGPSGSGKTTLLNIISGIDNPSSGDIFFNDMNVSSYTDYELTMYRKNNLGIIFQFFNLIDDLTTIENISLPLILQNHDKSEAYKKSKILCHSLNLEHIQDRKTCFLSGGEAQRVAIARALITKPKLILADEPTGNLDKENSQKTINLLINSCRENNASLLMVSHDESLMKEFDKVYYIDSGKLHY